MPSPSGTTQDLAKLISQSLFEGGEIPAIPDALRQPHDISWAADWRSLRDVQTAIGTFVKDGGCDSAFRQLLDRWPEMILYISEGGGRKTSENGVWPDVWMELLNERKHRGETISGVATLELIFERFGMEAFPRMKQLTEQDENERHAALKNMMGAWRAIPSKDDNLPQSAYIRPFFRDDPSGLEFLYTRFPNLFSIGKAGAGMLEVSITHHKPHFTRELLRLGIRPNPEMSFGMHPVHFACLSMRAEKMVERLRGNGNRYAVVPVDADSIPWESMDAMIDFLIDAELAEPDAMATVTEKVGVRKDSSGKTVRRPSSIPKANESCEDWARRQVYADGSNKAAVAFVNRQLQKHGLRIGDVAKKTGRRRTLTP